MEIKSPTNLFYGWVIVAISNITLMVAFGVRLSFTVFFVALVNEFGWMREEASIIFSTSMVVFAATSTMAGKAVDRWGARRTFGVGAFVLSLGLYLSSKIQSFPQLIFAYGVVAGLGITILGLGPQASVIARWFKQKRGLAIGIAFAGTGIGSLLIIPGVEFIISNYGWRNAYLVLAGLTLAVLPLNAFLLRLNPEDLNLQVDGGKNNQTYNSTFDRAENWGRRDISRSTSFWLLMIAAMGAIGPVRMLTVHQLAIFVDAGYLQSYATLAIGFSGAVTAITFFVFGGLSDRLGRNIVYLGGSLSLLMAIALLGLLQSSQSSILIWVYAVLLGLGEGSRSSLVTAAASDLFPGNNLGFVNGAIGAAFGVGAAILPWLAGRFFDLQNTYITVFIIAGFTVVISNFFLWIAPNPKFHKKMG